MIHTKTGLGAYLANKRAASGRSLRGVSSALKLSKSTLARWEFEEGIPQLDELLSLLVYYKLPQDEIEWAVSTFRKVDELLPSQISMRRDLLRFARCRSGLSLRVAAHILGVNHTTLTHWESGHRWPGDVQMDAALIAMGATRKEIDYLETNIDSVLRPSKSLDQIESRIREVRQSILLGGTKDFDLEYFRLRGILLSEKSSASRALSFELLAVYVRWLDWWKRPESHSLAIRELPGLQVADPSQDWVPIIRAAACYYAEIKRDVETAIDLVDHACKRLRGTRNESQLLREGADLRLQVHEWRDARELIARSRNLPSGEESEKQREYCLNVVEAQSWSGEGEHNRALDIMPGQIHADSYLAASSAVVGAKIYRAAGMFDEAERTLTEATTRCREQELPHLMKSLVEAHNFKRADDAFVVA